MMKNNKGFSIIEIIITLALMGILTGVVFGVTRYVQYGNTKRCFTEIVTTMEKVKMDTLSREKTPYLYLFSREGNYYIKVSEEESITSISQLTNARQIGNGNIRIYKDAGGGNVLIGEEDYITLAYKKSNGAFLDTKVDFEKIILEGKQRYTIYLVKDTGKYYVESITE